MLKIIEYTDKYKEKVVNLLTEIILNEFEMEENIDDIINYDYNKYKNNSGNLWIAIDEEDKVHATIAIENDIRKREAKLVRMYLNKEHRGSGIATEMLNKAINFVKGLEYDRIILGTYKKLERAIGFYEKNGFKEYKNENFDNGEARFYALTI